jgi:saccharopine dehydrogenase-like NADP-dependent oxidoreductase
VRVAIVGAAGTIGPAIARDLAESPEFDGLLLLDREGARVRAVAQEQCAGSAAAVVAAPVDAADRLALTLALEGYGLVVNAASYRLNLAVMDACLAAGSAYVDLGGLYHVSARQFGMHDAFAAAGLLAVLGCGAAPGKTNVMAATAAARLDEVTAVRCASGSVDLDPPSGFWTPYAVETLIDEVTLEPIVVRAGTPTPIAPLSDGGAVVFPDPIGRCDSIYTLHSEVLTLPGSLGASECDFRLCLARDVLAQLVERARAADDAATASEERARPSPKTWSAQSVEVSGIRDGRPATIALSALTRPHERWGLGGGVVSTASVAAATARLYARGRLGAVAGVVPPEGVLRVEDLFPELEARGCSFEFEER